MSILPREYLETFVRNPHAADRNEVREMARELMRERDRVAEVLEQRAVARARVAQLEGLVNDLADPDPCTQFDHHGYCQTHGWLTSDSRCPHARAAELREVQS